MSPTTSPNTPPLTPITKAEYEQIVEGERQRLTTLKARLLMEHAFWSTIIMPMQLVPSPLLQTYGATDCSDTIYFNPLRTRTLPLKQLGFLLVHEAIHAVYLHLQRRNGRNPELWAAAIDYATNGMTIDIKRGNGQPLYEFIPGGLLDKTFSDKSAEIIYDELLKEEKKKPGAFDKRMNKDGTPSSDSGADGTPPSLEFDPSEFPNPLRPGDNFGGRIDSHLAPDMDPTVEERIKDRLIEAHENWEAAKQRGSMPDGLLRVIKAIRAARVPWERVLRQYAGTCLNKDDMSYFPPHRRRLVINNLIMPSLRSESAGNLVAVIDTSGSVNPDKITTFMTEIGKLAEYAEELTILSHDAKVQTVIRTQDAPVFLQKLKFGEAKLGGGGGTDHRPVFDWLAKERLLPDLMICCTDMCSVFPDKKPPYPVLWCVTKEDQTTYPFGAMVVIPDKPTK